MLAFGSPDVGIAKTRLVWVPKPLPASHHVADLILVPSSG
jgi:deoxyinosine 3'endonuclease (endonuclease V)